MLKLLGQEASDIFLPTTAPNDVASSRVSPLHPGLLGSKHNRWIATGRRELCHSSFVEKTIHRVDLLHYFPDDIGVISTFYADSRPEERIEPINLPHPDNVN